MTGVQAIDIDSKYDLSGVLFDQYKRLVNEVNPNLLTSLLS